MAIYMAYDSNNNAGFYMDNVHKDIPNNKIQISKEVWEKLLTDGKEYTIKKAYEYSREEIQIQDFYNVFEEKPIDLNKEYPETPEQRLREENESMKQSIAELTVLVTSMMGGGA